MQKKLSLRNGTIQLPAYLPDATFGQVRSLDATDSEQNPKIIAFSQDGKSLVSLSARGTLTSWDINTESWRDQLCGRVGRNFTQDELAFYFAGEPYRKTCKQWPEGK